MSKCSDVPSFLITTNSFCVQREKKVLVMPKLPVWSRPHYENLLGFVYDNNDQGGLDEVSDETALSASAEDLELEDVEEAEF